MTQDPRARASAAAPRSANLFTRDAPDPLVRPLEPEPLNAARHTGSISPERAALIALQLRIADAIRQQLAPDLDPDLPLDRTPEVVEVARGQINGLLASGQLQLSPRVDHRELAKDVLAEIFGYGPIQELVDSERLNEIMVNGPYLVFFEQGGKLVESGRKFLDVAHVERVIRRILKPLGREATPRVPLVDARLPNGSRVNVAVAPVAVDGPSISIRKFPRKRLGLDDLVRTGSITYEIGEFLKALVIARQNIVVSGGTGSGKTTLINCLCDHLPAGERIVTIEDAAELQINQRNLVRMETKRASGDDAGVTIRDCVRNAMRMRPDRIIVGECRGGEAMDMIMAMNTGHDGSMTSVHANDPRACLARLETLAMMGDTNIPVLLVRRQIATSINIIVQIARLRDGSRKVTHISELSGMEGDVVRLGEIFRFVDDGLDQDGRVKGTHVAAGTRPRCDEEFKNLGLELPANVYSRS